MIGYRETSTHIVASELKDPICHSNECQIGSFSSEATICAVSWSVLRMGALVQWLKLLAWKV